MSEARHETWTPNFTVEEVLEVLSEFEQEARKDENWKAAYAFNDAREMIARAYLPNVATPARNRRGHIFNCDCDKCLEDAENAGDFERGN